MVSFKKYRWYIVLIVFLIISFFIYKVVSNRKNPVKSYTVQKKTIKDTLTLSGKLAADQDSIVQFQSGGLISWVGVKVGDTVKKGQAIASLDVRQLQDTMQKYLNTYAKTRSINDQQQDNTREVVIGALGYDARQSLLRTAAQVQFDLNNSVLDVQIQNLALQYATIYSPIDGLVVRVDTPQAGVNFYYPTQAQFEIINPSTLYFSALADQTDVVKLSTSMPAEIIFDSYPDDSVLANVSTIAFIPKAGETGTVYEVKLTFDQANKDYRLGMTGDVNFILGQRAGVITVPTSYIKDDAGKKYVLVGKNKVKTYIKTGTTIDNDTKVTSGLKEGDVVYD